MKGKKSTGACASWKDPPFVRLARPKGQSILWQMKKCDDRCDAQFCLSFNGRGWNGWRRLDATMSRPVSYFRLDRYCICLLKFLCYSTGNIVLFLLLLLLFLLLLLLLFLEGHCPRKYLRYVDNLKCPAKKNPTSNNVDYLSSIKLLLLQTKLCFDNIYSYSHYKNSSVLQNIEHKNLPLQDDEIMKDIIYLRWHSQIIVNKNGAIFLKGNHIEMISFFKYQSRNTSVDLQTTQKYTIICREMKTKKSFIAFIKHAIFLCAENNKNKHAHRYIVFIYVCIFMANWNY